jgi:hypothetical protein
MSVAPIAAMSWPEEPFIFMPGIDGWLGIDSPEGMLMPGMACDADPAAGIFIPGID